MVRKKMALALLVATLVCTAVSANVAPAYADSESFIAEMQLFPYGFAPLGWMECTGQVLAPQRGAALFSLIGTKFGGDGASTFALPDMRGAEPTKDMRYYIATTGIYPEDNGGGNEDYVGEIRLFPYVFEPNGYMRCDGRILNIAEYVLLFSLIGTIYGGDGMATFALPDMRSMEPNEYTGYFINTTGVFPNRD